MWRENVVDGPFSQRSASGLMNYYDRNRMTINRARRSRTNAQREITKLPRSQSELQPVKPQQLNGDKTSKKCDSKNHKSTINDTTDECSPDLKSANTCAATDARCRINEEVKIFKVWGNLRKVGYPKIHSTLPTQRDIERERKIIEFERIHRNHPHQVEYKRLWEIFHRDDTMAPPTIEDTR
ncbi:uncharacterized protein LOC141906490 [Tubulanus polymorphus]|uniref:uncharacterized protein LOC141906490 n=1 Tax=Tubulanus polymorphus TaxID=672921 RepID=UPI003DA5C5FD